MSILIKGMKLPKNGTYILDFASDEDGENTICRIEEQYSNGGGKLIEHKGVVEVPEPHGRLIDADKLFSELVWAKDMSMSLKFAIAIKDNAPTIIEAEGEEHPGDV